MHFAVDQQNGNGLSPSVSFICALIIVPAPLLGSQQNMSNLLNWKKSHQLKPRTLRFPVRYIKKRVHTLLLSQLYRESGLGGYTRDSQSLAFNVITRFKKHVVNNIKIFKKIYHSSIHPMLCCTYNNCYVIISSQT